MRKIMIFLLCLGLFVSVIPGVSAQEADWLEDIQAQMEATPRVSVDNSVVNASIIFQNVAEPTTCTLRWYIGDILCAEEFQFQLRNGATAQLECSVHFNDDTQFRTPVWAEISVGEQTRVFSVTVQVMPIPEPPENPGRSHYQIHVIRNQCAVIVYEKDENGEYTVISNVFVCSPGQYNWTVTGKFKIANKWRWLGLLGGVTGQYTSQFWGDFLFHTVPYYGYEEDTLKWTEYNKLGEPASAGCIRMAVCDAKWIYDHCPEHTQVLVYDADSLPVVNPVPIRINGDSPNRNWDPTDPREDNPTRAAEVPEVVEITIRRTPPKTPLWEQIG